MPELPELEIARRQLSRWSAGRSLTGIELADPAVVRRTLSTKPSDAVPDGAVALGALVGRPAGEVRRHGKRLALMLGDDALCAHFGMTGLFVRRPVGDAAPSFARLGLRFDDLVVWFVDGRRFGCVHVSPADRVDAVLRDRQGPDLWLEPPSAITLKAALKGKKPVKPALMEQDRVAGLGNIHAAEACHRAKIHPATTCDALTPAQLDALATAIRAQLAFAIDEGDTDGDVAYVNLGGPNPFAVYGRDDGACGTCHGSVSTEEQAGRTTYFCATCQPAPRPTAPRR